MGEAKKRSLSRSAILKNFDRCVYCSSTTSLTLEHMPPTGMFEKRQRPNGWEFGCCKRCNQGTRGADALAQFVAKMEPISESDWKLTDILKLRSGVNKYAPGVLDELFGQRQWSDTLLERNHLLYRTTVGRADGPLMRRYLNLFSAKAAMAAFYSFTGRAIQTDGLIFTEWYLNGGMNQEQYDHIVRIMPRFAQLKQGKLTSDGQFWLRYNSNEHDIVAALLSFHGSFHITVIATDNPEIYGGLRGIFEKLIRADRPTINLTQPGLPELETNHASAKCAD